MHAHSPIEVEMTLLIGEQLELIHPQVGVVVDDVEVSGRHRASSHLVVDEIEIHPGDGTGKSNGRFRDRLKLIIVFNWQLNDIESIN